MHEVALRLGCKQPDIVKKSLEPDIRNDENIHTEIKVGKADVGECRGGFVEIIVRGKKLSHLKAIINSYLSIISTLDEIEDIK